METSGALLMRPGVENSRARPSNKLGLEGGFVHLHKSSEIMLLYTRSKRAILTTVSMPSSTP